MRLPAGGKAVLSGLVAVMLGAGAPASEGANLATIGLSTARGRSGAAVGLSGASFPVPRAGAGLAATPVVIHWAGEDGPVLAEAVPDRFGSVAATVTIPDAAPGVYVIVATQLTPRWAPGAPPDQPPALFAEPGTPARTSFEVLPAGTVTVRAPVAGEQAGAPGDLDSTVWIVLTAAFGAVALSLFGGGLIAFVHQSRRSKMSAEARWVPPGW